MLKDAICVVLTFLSFFSYVYASKPIEESELETIPIVNYDYPGKSRGGNQAPQFNHIDTVYSMVGGDSIGIIISAYDLDGDSISFNFLSLPYNSGYQSISMDSILFYFNPIFTQVGSHMVVVSVNDNIFTDTLRLRIAVLDSTNNPPIFDPINPQAVNEGEVLSLFITADDPGSPDAPVIILNNPHPNSVFTPNGDGTATYEYSPDFYDAGVDTLEFIAIDSEALQGTLHVEITTVETNLPPELTYEGDSVAIQGETLIADLIATDSTDGDGGPIFTSALYLPQNAQFIDNGDHTGTFTYSPTYDQVGIDSAVFIALDDGDPPLSDSILVQLETRAQNRAPIWDPVNSYQINQAETLTVDLFAYDPDGDTLILRLPDNPEPPRNCSIVDLGNGTGQLIFAPDYTQQGIYTIPVEVHDLLARTLMFVFVMVNDLGNQPPTLYPVSSNDTLTMVEGEILEFTVLATDPDSTPPQLLLEGAPERNFEYSDSGDGTMSVRFYPYFYQSGIYDLTFIANDQDTVGVSDTMYVTIVVYEYGNQIPRISVIPDRVIDEGQTLSFNVIANDPDSTVPSIVLLNPIANSTFFDSGSGVGMFSLTPNYFQSGSYTLIFRAIDDEDSMVVFDRSVLISVNNVNRQPIIEPIDNYLVNENDSLGFLVIASDPDSTTPVLMQYGFLENSVFIDSGNGMGYFSLEPNFDQDSGSPYNIFFRAYDSEDSLVFTQQSTTITIRDVNRLPVINPLPSDTSAPDGSEFFMEISGSDPDGDIPELFVTNLPTSAIIIDHGDGTALFRFLTEIGDTNSYLMYFGIEDGRYPDVRDSQSVSIHLHLVDEHSPIFITSNDTLRLIPEVELVFLIQAIDYDNDLLEVFPIDELPLNALFNDNGNGTAQFIWTPNQLQIDSLFFNRFVVSDETAKTDTLKISFIVSDFFRYIPADANMAAGLWPPAVIGADVTYLVNYFRAISTPCILDGFYASGDANGDCLVIGSDVTYLVNYFRALNDLQYCPDYEPAWPPLPVEAPDGWPNCE